MANRNFFNRILSGEADVTILNARCDIGLAGAVSNVIGTAITTITKESATGLYSITLPDAYDAFLFGNVKFSKTVENAAKTAVTGVSEVNTFTFAAKASCTSGDFAVITDTAGAKWAFSIDVTGSAAEPTSALWTAVAAANKVHVDISAATSGDDVAAAVRAAFAALTGIGTVITVGAASTDHFAVTHVLRAVVATASLYKEDGTATPTSVTVAKTTTGIATKVDPATGHESITTAAAHGISTGRYGALSIDSGSLPTGWSATNYYAVAVSTTELAFATSLANAEAGTKVAISDYGDAGKIITFTPAAPFGSLVASNEFTSTTLKADVQSLTKIYIQCYDYAGAVVNPANGTKMYVELHVRNSSVDAAGE